MKFIYNILLVTLVVMNTVQGLAVKVLLSDDHSEPWSISSPRGVIVRDAQTERIFPKNVTTHVLTLHGIKDSLIVNGKKLSSKHVWIEPLDGYLVYQDNEYEGRFSVLYHKDTWFLISVLDVEDYIYSVLKTESWPGWPLEVNKVFAVACRSYLLHQLLQLEGKNLPYHIKNTNYHQTYQGMHSNDVVRQAVDETCGFFLAYNDHPILAMFDCCCGGVIPAKIAGHIDFSKAPYLARTYPCTYCSDSKLFSWSASYSVEDFRLLMQEGHSHIVHPIRDVKVARKDKAGLVQTVMVKTNKNNFSLKARKMYKLFKGVKSYCFSIFKKGKTVTVTGKGYGHHMGICQWGAREMVRQGWSYRDILQFYYPDTYFMKLASSSSKENNLV